MFCLITGFYLYLHGFKMLDQNLRVLYSMHYCEDHDILAKSAFGYYGSAGINVYLSPSIVHKLTFDSVL